MEGNTKMKRIQTICNLLLAVIVFISNSRVSFANSCSEYDYLLASVGVPHGSLGGHWGRCFWTSDVSLPALLLFPIVIFLRICYNHPEQKV